MKRLNINLSIEEKQKIQNFLELKLKRKIEKEEVQEFANCGCGFDDIKPYQNHPMFGFPVNPLICLK